jgi:hypothetical protein
VTERERGRVKEKSETEREREREKSKRVCLRDRESSRHVFLNHELTQEKGRQEKYALSHIQCVNWFQR